VRGLQHHERAVDRLHRGQRAAVNLAGIHHDQTRRGQELASPKHLVPSRLVSVSLQLLPSAPRPVKHRSRLRVHLGTAEFLAQVSLLDRNRLAPGETAFAQLYLGEEAVCVWSQPLVLRSESPVETIGGGHVLDPQAAKLRRGDPAAVEMLEAWRSSEPARRASAAAYFAGIREWHPDEWARTAGIDDPGAVYARLVDAGEVLEIPVSASRTLRVHRRVVQQVADRVEALLKKLHRDNPLRLTLDRQALIARFRYLDEAVLRYVLQRMREAGRVRLTAGGVALAGEGPKLSQNERKQLAELIETFRAAGMHAPSVKQCQERASRSQQSVPQLIALAAANGDLVEIGPDYFLHADVDRELQERLRRAMADGRGMTLSEIRELLDSTRKYAVPYCEYLDRIGFTRREGDLRYLA